MSKKDTSLFIVLAFRFGGKDHTFPIGAFTSLSKAQAAAKAHRFFRGGKYSHRIYSFTPDVADDDEGHIVTNRPCIEEQPE